MSRKEKKNFAIKYCSSLLVLISMYVLFVEVFIDKLMSVLEYNNIMANDLMLILIQTVIVVAIAGLAIELYVKKKKSRMIGSGFVAIVLAFVTRNMFIRGAYPFVRTIEYHYNMYYFDEDLLEDTGSFTAGDMRVFLIIVGVVLLTVINYGIISKPKKVALISMLTIVSPIMIFLYVGAMPEVADSLMYICIVIIYVALNRTDENTDTKNYIIPVGIIVGLIMISMGVYGMLSQYKLDNIQTFETMKSKIIVVEEKLRKGEYLEALNEISQFDWQNIIPVTTAGKTLTISKDGDLGNLSNRSLGSSKRLEIYCDKIPSENVYFKGFTGVTYNGEEWKPVSEKTLSEFMDEKLSDKELIDIQHLFYSHLKEENIYEEDLINYRVINRAGKKNRAYEPYGTWSTDDLIPCLDSYMNTTKDDVYYETNLGNVDWTLESYVSALLEGVYDIDGVFQESELTEEDKEHAELVAKYFGYAREYYTKGAGDDEALKKAIESRINAGDEYFYRLDPSKKDEEQYVNAVYQIRELLTFYFYEGFEYSLNPGKAKYGKSPLLYFLEDNRRGFCVHYASVTTIALQTFGLPARYVEGYYVPSEAFEIQDDGTYMATVTDDMAHAWSEVLTIDGGWEVVETTPCYNSLTYVDAQTAQETQEERGTTEPVITTTVETTTQAVTTTEQAESSQKESDTTSTITVAEKKTVGRGNIISTIIKSVILKILVVILLFTLIVIAQAQIRRVIRYKRFRNRNQSKGCLRMYNSVVDMCGVEDFSIKNMSAGEQLEVLSKKFDMLEDDEWKWMINTAYEAAFSNREISRKMYIRMESDMRRVRKKLMLNMGILKKIILLYILAL